MDRELRIVRVVGAAGVMRVMGQVGEVGDGCRRSGKGNGKSTGRCISGSNWNRGGMGVVGVIDVVVGVGVGRGGGGGRVGVVRPVGITTKGVLDILGGSIGSRRNRRNS